MHLLFGDMYGKWKSATNDLSYVFTFFCRCETFESEMWQLTERILARYFRIRYRHGHRHSDLLAQSLKKIADSFAIHLNTLKCFTKYRHTCKNLRMSNMGTQDTDMSARVDRNTSSDTTTQANRSFGSVPLHPKWCPECLGKGIRSKVKVFNLNADQDAIYMCTNMQVSRISEKKGWTLLHN